MIVLFLQMLIPWGWFQIFISWYYTLFMPIAMITNLGLDAWAAYEIYPKVHRYSTMRQVAFGTIVFDFLTHFYSLHLKTYIITLNKFKYWDT